jgi:ankyrin repeat protein
MRKWVFFIIISFLFISCNSPPTDLNSSLIQAVKDGDIDRVRLLIAQGADINTRDNRGGTPLHWAVYYNRKEIAKLLLMQGADINIKDKNGLTAIDVARINRRKEILDLLKKYNN